LLSWILPWGIGLYLGGWSYLWNQILKCKARIKISIYNLNSIPHLPLGVGFYLVELDFKWEVGFYFGKLNFTLGRWNLPLRLVLLVELDFKI
jgi:hypothetical protein